MFPKKHKPAYANTWFSVDSQWKIKHRSNLHFDPGWQEIHSFGWQNQCLELKFEFSNSTPEYAESPPWTKAKH